MRILLLTRYGRIGASSRVRFYQYLPSLEGHGVEATVCPLFEDEYLEDLYAGNRRRVRTVLGSYLGRLGCLLRRRRFDLVWLEKELFPWLPAWGEIVLSRSMPYVADYDDAIFHGYDLHQRRLAAALFGGKIDAVMRRAAVVVAGNGYIAERARRAGARRVEILPSVIDPDRYPAGPDTPGGGFTIGWIGTPFTAKHLREAEPALREICRDGGGRVVLVGVPANPMRGVTAEVRPWSEETEIREIGGFTVGIMPLPDDPWERGKCGFKLIQYMGCGRPVVGSPVGVNREIITHGVNGFLAADRDSWVRCLSALREDTALRRAMGANGRRTVETRYSLRIVAPRLIEILGAAAGHG